MPERTPVLSFSIAEDELRKLPLRDMVGDYAAWDYFQSIDRPENREFVRRFKANSTVRDRVTSDVIEAAYCSVHLWAQAVVEAESEEVADVLKAIRHQSLNAPEGIVSVDDETQHTWRPVYVGQIRADGQFDLVWRSEKPVRPIPYPILAIACGVGRVSGWFVSELGRLGKPRFPRRAVARGGDTPGSASGSADKASDVSSSGSHKLEAARLTAMPFFSRFVQVRPAMTLRLGSFLLSRISITTQLVIWFLCLSLIPCVVLTGIISYLSNQSLKRTVRQGLLAISDAKTTQLETFMRERRGDLNVASRYPAIVDAIPKLKGGPAARSRFDSPAYLELARSVRPFMANFVDSFGYSNAYLFDTDGTLLFQLKTELDIGSNLLNGPLKDSELAEVFDRVRTLLQIEVSDYQMYPGRSEPAAFIASPVFNRPGPDHRICGSGAGQPASISRLQRL